MPNCWDLHVDEGSSRCRPDGQILLVFRGVRIVDLSVSQFLFVFCCAVLGSTDDTISTPISWFCVLCFVFFDNDDDDVSGG